MVMLDRRMLMIGAAALPTAAAAARFTPAWQADEAEWQAIAAQYDVTREVIQLENGNWGMMPLPVMRAYEAAVERLNRDSSYYLRRGYAADARAVHERMASALGVPPDEIAFTRNASEALKALIGGYNRLQPGDAILYADLDYVSMQACMKNLALRHRAQLVTIDLPEPATKQGLIDAYAAAFEANPRLKLALLTHLSHRTGLVLPVREIAALARARGIDTIVDAAHSWCQIDFSLPDLDCDFVGINGHKWLAAPLGVGVIHIRKSALDRIDIDGANEPDATGVDARVHVGTADVAALLAVPAALDFHQSIGGARKAARLRALRDRWVKPLRGVPGIEILTPDDPTLYGAITSFRFAGQTSTAQNVALARRLLDEHGIFTVDRDGVAKGSCVRVTPSLFNSFSDMDALASALKAMRA